MPYHRLPLEKVASRGLAPCAATMYQLNLRFPSSANWPLSKFHKGRAKSWAKFQLLSDTFWALRALYCSSIQVSVNDSLYIDVALRFTKWSKALIWPNLCPYSPSRHTIINDHRVQTNTIYNHYPWPSVVGSTGLFGLSDNRFRSPWCSWRTCPYVFSRQRTRFGDRQANCSWGRYLWVASYIHPP